MNESKHEAPPPPPELVKPPRLKSRHGRDRDRASENVLLVNVDLTESITMYQKDKAFTGPNGAALARLDNLTSKWRGVRRLGPLSYLFWRR